MSLLHLRQFLALLVFAGCVMTVEESEARRKPSPRVKSYDNGLRLVVIADRTRKLVEVEQWFDAGSMRDPQGKEGLAHLFEHLFVRDWNPDPTSRQQLELATVERNALTSVTDMRLTTLCTKERLPRVLELELERLQLFDPSPDIFERERFVVRQETVLRAPGRMSSVLVHKTLQSAYGDHPYGRPVGGTDSSLVSITRDDMVEFWQQAIAPQGLTLVIKGPVRSSKVIALVDSTFARLPRSETWQPSEPVGPPSRVRTTVEIQSPGENRFVALLGFRLPAATPREAILALLATGVLWGEQLRPTSIPTTEEIFWAISSSHVYPEDPMFTNQYLRSWAWEELWKDLRESRRAIAHADSFAARKRKVTDAKSPEAMLKFLPPDLLLAEGKWFAGGDSILKSIDQGEVEAFLDEYLVSNNASIGFGHGRLVSEDFRLELKGLARADSWGAPVAPETDRIDDASAVEEMAHLAERRGFAIEYHTLANGIPVLMRPFSGFHDMHVGGARTYRYPKQARKKPGLMQAYGLVVDLDSSNGASSWKRLRYGPRVEPTAQTLWFECVGARKVLGAMTRLMVERFEDKEFNVKTWRLILDYPEHFLSPSSYSKRREADVLRWESMFGSEAVFLGDYRASPKDVEKWKYDHLRDLHKNVMKSRDLRLVVAGSFTPADVLAEMNYTLGKLDGYKNRQEYQPLERLQQAPFAAVVSDFKRSDTVITFSFQSIPHRPSGNWATAEVALECIREQLYTRLRHSEGLSYSVGSRVQHFADDLLFEVNINTFPAATARVVEIVRGELAKMNEGLDAALFRRAQLLAAKRTLQKLDSPRRSFDLMVTLAWSAETVEQPLAAIAAVQHEDVESMLHAVIDPSMHSVTACGPILEEEAAQLRDILNP